MTGRIKQIISEMGLSTRAFALRCELRQNTLNNQLNGVRDLSLSTVSAILAAFPQISAEWLMRGEGAMYASEPAVPQNETILKLADTIATLQSALNDKQAIAAALAERVRQLEMLTKTK